MYKCKRFCRNCRGRRGKFRTKQVDEADVEELMDALSFKLKQQVIQRRRSSLSASQKYKAEEKP